MIYQILLLLLSFITSPLCQYVRLPSGASFHNKGGHATINRDAYEIPVQNSVNQRPSPGLIAPPRMQVASSPAESASYPTGSINSPSVSGQHHVTAGGLNYAEFKQMMANKIIEKANTEAAAERAEVHRQTLGDKKSFVESLHIKNEHQPEAAKSAALGQTYTALGGGQFYQSLFGGKNGFSPLSFFLGAGGRGGSSSPFFVPVPIVVPPPPPPPPGPKCYTNLSGFLCCNVTLEKAMEMAYQEAKAEGISLCNVQKIASAVQDATEKKFGTTFETVAAHRDFVAKVNFQGDLNCKIEIDGKFMLAYATPNAKESEVNIIDANSFFSGDAEELLEANNGTDGNKPTYIVYGPIR